MIEDYNRYMEDCNMRVRYCVFRISEKFLHPIFFWFLDVSVCNAWILSVLRLERLELIDQLISSLLGELEKQKPSQVAASQHLLDCLKFPSGDHVIFMNALAAAYNAEGDFQIQV